MKKLLNKAAQLFRFKEPVWDSAKGKAFLWVPFLCFFFMLMGFVDSREADKTINNIFVHIDYTYDNYFVGKEDVLDLLTNNGKDLLIGKTVDNIRLKELEQRIKTHNFVEDAQVFKDHKGQLIVNIIQRRPIARILDQHGPQAYIDDKGDCLPASERFTARVLLIDGDFSQKLKSADFLSSKEGSAYLDLLKFINKDPFWKAQIAQMTVDKKGSICLYTQIGDQKIVFGLPENIEAKFKKLKIFYKEIYPFKGYNTYDKVSLKYENQIICE